MKDYYSEKDARRAFDRLDRRLRQENLVPSPKRGVAWLPRLYWVAAGLVVLLLSVLAVEGWRSTTSEAIRVVEKVNPPGQRTRLQLPDGTRVWLGADSQLSYPHQFSDDHREISLRGKAFFEVVRDTLRPFTIRTSTAQVKVLGTSFNVYAPATGSVETVVVSGSVALGTSDSRSSEHPLVLKENERAVLDPATGQIEKSTVAPYAYVAWKDGTLVFKDQPLAEVLVELERWYGVRFSVENQAIKSCRITAKFDNLSLTTLLDQVQFIVPITYRQDWKQVYLSGNSCAPEVR